MGVSHKMIKNKNKITNILSYKYFQDFVFIFILVIVNGMYFYNSNYLTKIDVDTAQHEYSLLAGMMNIYKDGEIPLWYPYVWGGQTSFNSLIPVFYPISIVLGNIFYNSETKLLSYFVIQAYLATYIVILSIGIYYMLRVFGQNKKVAFTIAILISFSPTLVSMKQWLRLLHSISWIPFSIAFLKKIYCEPKYIRYYIFYAISFALSVFAQVSYGALLNTLCIGLFFITHILDKSTSISNKFILFKSTFFAYITGIIFSSPMLFPFIEFIGKSYRYIPGIDDYNFSGKIPYDIYSELHFEIPHIKDMMVGKGTGFLSISLLLVVFLIFGFFSKYSKDRKSLNFGILIIIFVVFCGSGIIFSNFMYYIPFFDSFKPLIQYASIFYIGVSIVASEGLSNYIEYLKDNDIEKKEKFYNITLLSIIILGIISFNFLPVNYDKNEIFLLIVTTFIILIFILKIKINNYVFSILLIGGIFSNSIYFNSNWTFGKLERDVVVQNVEKVNDTMRIEMNEGISKDIIKDRIVPWSESTIYPQNILSIVGLKDSIGYFNPTYKKIYDIHMFVNLRNRSTLQNIKYFLSDDSLKEKNLIKWLESLGFKDFTNIKIFKDYNDDTKLDVKVLKSNFANGVAWMVYDYEVYDNNTNTQTKMNYLNNIDLRYKTIVNIDTVKNEELVNVKKYTDVFSNVEVNSIRNNYLSLSVSSDKDGILVFSETYYPGWNAFIDGKKVDIWEVNHSFRGVYLKSGKHLVEMIFFPRTLTISMILLILIILIFGYIYIKNKRLKNNN